MRIGAIFARGSCRALKWAALFGVVFALGAVHAAAQELTIRDVALDSYDLTEGRTARVTVTVDAPRTIAADSEDAVVIELVGTPGLPGIDTGEGIERADIFFLGLAEAAHADATAIRATKEVEYETTDVGDVLSVSFDMELRHDDDAENEKFYVEAWVVDTVGAPQARGAEDYATTQPRRIAEIDDEETQTYKVEFYRHTTSPDDETTFTLADHTKITTATGATNVSEGDQNIRAVLSAEPDRTIPLYYSVLVDGRSQTDFVDVQNPTAEGAILNADGTGSWALLDFFTNDGNRADETATVTVLWRQERATSRPMGEVTAMVGVEDDHELPVPTVTGTRDREVGGDRVSSVTEGGDSVWLTVQVSRTRRVSATVTRTLTPEALTIDLAPADQGASYRVVPNRLEFDEFETGGSTTATMVVELEALDDDWVGDDEFTLSMVTTGESSLYGDGETTTEAYTLTVVDTTATLIEPETDENVKKAVDEAIAAGQDDEDGLNPGEYFMVSVDRMFTGSAPGATVNYSARVDDGVAATVSISGEMVTVNAVQAGTATVIVTAVVDTPSSAIPQTVNDTAQVPFTVTVVNKPLRVKLEADPADAVMEGGTIKLIATAERAVLADDDATVSLTVTGSVEGTPPTEIAIPVGQMMFDGVELMVKNDDQVMAMDPVVVVGSGGGLEMDPTVLSIAVTEDDTAPEVEPTVKAKADPQSVFDANVGADFVKGGDAVSFDAGDLFEPFGADVDPVYAVSTSDETKVGAVINGSTLMLTPVGYGSATVEVTVTDRTSGDFDRASGTVMVGLSEVSVDVVAAEMTIDEGDSTMITATASRPLEGDETLTINLSVVGDAMLSVESITIAAPGQSGTATVTAMEDDDDYEDETVTVVASGDGITGNIEIPISVTDDDVPPEPTVYTYSLSAPPTAMEGDTVTVTATAMVDGASMAVEDETVVMLAHAVSSTLAPDQYTGQMSITIMAGMATGETTLTITDDEMVEADAQLDLVGTVGAVSAGTVSIMVSDNDVATTYSLAVTDNLAPVTSLMEGDDPVTVTVTASQASSMATTVMVMAGMGSTADASDFSVTGITIPANDTEGVGILTITDDPDVEGTETLALVAMVGDVMSDPVMITIEDNDVATTFSLMASANSVMEGGEVTITATASQPVRGNVEIGLMRDGSSTATQGETGDFTLNQGGMITIMDGQTMGSVTLTARDDDEVEGTESVTLNGTMDSGSVTIEIMDNDEPTVYTYSLSASPTSVTEGGEVTITATASSAVEADTMVTLVRDASSTLAPDQYTVAMSITIGEGMTTGTTTLTITQDYDVEADATLVLAGNVGGMSAGMVTIAVTDDDMETTYTLAITDNTMPVTSLTEGDGPVTVTVTASQMVREAMMVEVMAAANSQADASDFSVSAISIAAGSDTGVGTLTITDDHDVEGTEVLSLVAMVGDAMSAPVMITVMDNDVETTYSLMASATSVMEGGEVTITATASQMVRSNVEVMLMRDGSSSAAADDFALSVPMITIMAGQTDGSLTLTATDDEDVEGNESLTLTATVDGASAGMVMITIEDNDVETTYSLSASAATVEEGGTVTITATASQAVRANTEVMVMRDAASTAAASDFSLDPPLITIMMGDTTGSLMLTAVDDVMVEGEESLTLAGSVDGMSAGSVMVSIMDNDVVSTFTLSGPMDTNLVEGQSYELTVMADPAVQVDTEVTIMRDGASSADDADFTVGSVMLSAGDDMGTTMLMVVDDGMDDSGHGMPEMLTIYGMANGESTNSLTFNLWDAAVPALPIIAQLLLAAFLAIGGYRRFRRR